MNTQAAFYAVRELFDPFVPECSLDLNHLNPDGNLASKSPPKQIVYSTSQKKDAYPSLTSWPYRLHTLANSSKPALWVHLKQVHGAQVIEVSRAGDTTANKETTLNVEKPPSALPLADALFTLEPNIALLVKTADCLPVIMVDVNKGSIGVAHAGWRGVLAGVVDNLLGCFLKNNSQLRDIQVIFAPSIQEINFEVQNDLIEAFAERNRFLSFKTVNNKKYANLPASAAKHLLDQGLPLANIKFSKDCTYSLTEKFYSFRRDKKLMGHNLTWVLKPH